MMFVLTLLILATVVLSFYSVDQVTAGVVQLLSGPGVFFILATVAVWVVWLVWRKRRARTDHLGDIPHES